MYAAETNYHDFSGLQQHKFILTVLEDRNQNGFHWAETNALAGPYFLQGL